MPKKNAKGAKMLPKAQATRIPEKIDKGNPSELSVAPAVAKKVKKEKAPKSQSAKTEKISICKRGYKVCRNIDCGEMIHINSRVCRKCGEVNATKK